MPSTSLVKWNGPRLLAIAEIDTQCAAAVAAVPSNPVLIDEDLRAYVLLLSAHVQGFCRDLYTESSQFVGNNVRASIQFLVQQFFTSRSALDHGNPNLDNINADFNRFGFTLDLKNARPGNEQRLTHLGQLNKAHNGFRGGGPEGAPSRYNRPDLPGP